MRSNNPILLAIGAALGFSVAYGIRGSQETRPIDSEPVVQELEKTIEETYTVSRVVDGDTIDVEQGIEVLLYRIRLLGMDTPEGGQPGFNEAKEFLKQETYGKSIILEKDPSGDLDKYGRLLRYIIVDGRNMNIEMVRLGYARARWHEGLKYEKEILEAEKEARDNKRGTWINR